MNKSICDNCWNNKSEKCGCYNGNVVDGKIVIKCINCNNFYPYDILDSCNLGCFQFFDEENGYFVNECTFFVKRESKITKNMDAWAIFDTKKGKELRNPSIMLPHIYDSEERAVTMRGVLQLDPTHHPIKKIVIEY